MAHYPQRRNPPPIEPIGTVRRKPPSSLTSTLLEQYNFRPFQDILPAKIREQVEKFDYQRPLIVYYNAYGLDPSYPLPEKIKLDNLLCNYPKIRYELCFKFYKSYEGIPKQEISIFDVPQSELSNYYYCLDGESQIVTIKLQCLKENVYSITYDGSFWFKGEYDVAKGTITIKRYGLRHTHYQFSLEDAFCKNLEKFLRSSFRASPTSIIK